MFALIALPTAKYCLKCCRISATKLISFAHQDDTWRGIRQRLHPGGGARVMVNLGQSPKGLDGRPMHPDGVMTIRALNAMHSVFDGEVSVLHIRNMDGDEAGNHSATQNTVALTGPFEGLQERWRDGVPARLRHLTEGYTWERYAFSSLPSE